MPFDTEAIPHLCSCFKRQRGCAEPSLGTEAAPEAEVNHFSQLCATEGFPAALLCDKCSQHSQHSKMEMQAEVLSLLSQGCDGLQLCCRAPLAAAEAISINVCMSLKLSSCCPAYLLLLVLSAHACPCLFLYPSWAPGSAIHQQGVLFLCNILHRLLFA